jgi:hypothetical protein
MQLSDSALVHEDYFFDVVTLETQDVCYGTMSVRFCSNLDSKQEPTYHQVLTDLASLMTCLCAFRQHSTLHISRSTSFGDNHVFLELSPHALDVALRRRHLHLNYRIPGLPASNLRNEYHGAM